MAYASLADVENILPPDEDMPESGREQINLLTALEEATDLVVGHLHPRVWSGEPDDDDVPADVPGAVRRVVARVALRCFLDAPENPGAESETQLMGPFSYALNWSRDAQARSVYLTESDELRLAPFIQGAGTVGHVPMWS